MILTNNNTKKTTIVTWNINSIKSRLSHLLEYLKETQPDIVLLQELKCLENAFPFMEIEDMGYNIAVNGEKTYNGVAILSKSPLEDITKELSGDDSDKQARYIEAVTNINNKTLRIASIYIPNGQTPGSDKFQYKMRFFDRLEQRANKLIQYGEIMVLGGDYNVAPEKIDVFDHKSLDGTTCYHIDERKKFRKLLNLGLFDAFRTANNNEQSFSWWDYRAGSWQHNKGMRIDHLLLSPEAADILQSCHIDQDVRGKEKPSDHAPVCCQLSV